MNYLIDLILKLGTVDRRWIFLIIGTVVIIPLFFPLGLPIRATKTTQKVYDTIEALPHGSNLLRIRTQYEARNTPHDFSRHAPFI